MLVDLSFAVEAGGVEANISFCDHFNDGFERFSLRVADGEELLGSDKSEEEVGQVLSGVVVTMGGDVSAELVLNHIGEQL